MRKTLVMVILALSSGIIGAQPNSIEHSSEPALPITSKAASIAYRCIAQKEFKNAWLSISPLQQEELVKDGANQTVLSIQKFFAQSTESSIKRLTEMGYSRRDELQSMFSEPAEIVSISRLDVDTALYYINNVRFFCKRNDFFWQSFSPVIRDLDAIEKKYPSNYRNMTYDQLRNQFPESYGAWMQVWHQRNNMLSFEDGCRECTISGISHRIESDLKRTVGTE